MLRWGRQAISVTMEYLIEHMKFDSENEDAYLHERNIDAFLLELATSFNIFLPPNIGKFDSKFKNPEPLNFHPST